MLGSGTRLFEHVGPHGFALEPTRTVESDYATHLSYRVARSAG